MPMKNKPLNSHAGTWRRPGGIVLLSILLLIPCFWQSRIQAGDFSSHVYNAWLAVQIQQGKVHGLSVVTQSNNVLFDLLLQWLLRHVGLNLAQRLAASVVVLIFSWGAIAFISALARKNSCFVAPSVAMLAYGFIYHLGFFNFYLSMGICLCYLAIFQKFGWRARMFSLPLLMLAWLAHPFPVIWALGMAAYLLVATRLRGWTRLWFFLLGIAALIAARFVLMAIYPCTWTSKQVYFITGANQVLVYGPKYILIFCGWLLTWVMLLRNLMREQGVMPVLSSLPFQLWLLNAVGTWLMPNSVTFPHYALPFTYVIDRTSFAAAIMACAVLAAAPMKLPERTALIAITVAFFCFLYRDTRELNQIEGNIDAVVTRIPPGQRVIGHFPAWSNRADPLNHAVDRACIGHCLAYANYEPSSLQFRVRAQPGNGVVMDNYDDVHAVEKGTYTIEPRDLPLYAAYLCDVRRREVCLRPMQAGETTSGLGFR